MRCPSRPVRSLTASLPAVVSAKGRKPSRKAFAIIVCEGIDAMTRINIAIVLIVTAALAGIGTAQTRTQGQQGQAGRYRLLSAQYKWLATDAERKLVVDDQNQ